MRTDGQERKTLYIDVKKAHLVAKCTQDVYVELPAEAVVQEDECGKLTYWQHYSCVLASVRFKRLLSSPVAFYHSERDVVGVVHGDDFVFVGVDRDLDFVLRVLKENYELKDRGRLGSGDHDKREVDMLGRKIRWHQWGFTWEGDERHRKMVIDFFGMGENSKRLMKNGYKEDEVKDVKESHELGAEEYKSHRMLAARLNFMAQDNTAIQYAAKEICRNMARPERAHFARIKKLARFLLGVETSRWEYPWQEEPEAANLKVFTDSDWAGCLRTRRSTSGGLVMLGWHPLRTWSSTQSVVATSSAEAELYSAAEGASRSLGLQSMLQEMGVQTSLAVSTDSSSAKSFASTRGLGRMRHLEVKDLWLQALMKDGEVTLRKSRAATMCLMC